MRVEPLGTHQGLKSGSGSLYTEEPAARSLLLERSFKDIEPQRCSMTTGTLRNEGEVTSFSPGVAQKLHLAPVGFLGTYRLPSGRGKDIQESSIISVHSWKSLSRGLSHTQFPTGDSKVKGQRDLCQKKLLSFQCFYVKSIEMFV